MHGDLTALIADRIDAYLAISGNTTPATKIRAIRRAYGSAFKRHLVLPPATTALDVATGVDRLLARLVDEAAEEYANERRES